MEYIIIIISAIFVNNIVLSKFLGICPFMGVSNKLSTATGMAGAVTFVLVIATIVTFLLQNNYALFIDYLFNQPSTYTPALTM